MFRRRRMIFEHEPSVIDNIFRSNPEFIGGGESGGSSRNGGGDDGWREKEERPKSKT